MPLLFVNSAARIVTLDNGVEGLLFLRLPTHRRTGIVRIIIPPIVKAGAQARRTSGYLDLDRRAAILVMHQLRIGSVGGCCRRGGGLGVLDVVRGRPTGYRWQGFVVEGGSVWPIMALFCGPS
jgi:hypothetical protein